MVRAVRAVAMTTRMRYHPLLATGAALGQQAWGHWGATARHGSQGLGVAGQAGGAVLAQVVRLKAFDEGGETDHLTTPQCTEQPLIRALLRALAWSLVQVVRWV